GHQSTSIIPKPTELEMETVRVKRTLLRGPQPPGIIHTLRRRTIGFHRDALHPSLVGPRLHQAYLTQFARVHETDGIPEVLLATLPLPHLYCAAVLGGGGHHSM